MGVKYLRILIVLLFLGFLLLYTWNARTGTLDSISTNAGLGITGAVLKLADMGTSSVQSLWFNYIDLTNVRAENLKLKEEIKELQREIDTHSEEKHELERLQTLLAVKVPENWTKVVAKVLGTKLGAFSALESILLDKGYIEGVSVGRPLMTDRYLLGRVYQASPISSIALLLEDLGSRVSVISENSRLQGILIGAGAAKPLELYFINQDAEIFIGEILYTSGLDNAFPKGIPVAKVIGSQSELSEVFQIYYAEPLADFSKLEEVLVLTPPSTWDSSNTSPVFSQKEFDLAP